MIQNVLRHMGGIEYFGIVSVCLFFAVFLAALLWSCCLKTTYLKSMQSLPLNDGSAPDAASPSGQPKGNPPHE